VPACLFLLLRRPEDVGQEIDGRSHDTPGPAPGRSAAEEVQWTAGEAVRTVTLWTLMLSTSLIVLVFMALSTHLVPHLVDQGVSPPLAALAVNLGGLTMVPASMAWGWLLDRTAPRHLVGATAALTLLLIAVMALLNDAWMFLPVGIIWGVGSASIGTVLRVVFAYYFGRESAGTVLGIVTPFRVLSQGAGILLAGVLYDLSGSYGSSFLVFAVLSMAALVAAMLTPTPRKGVPARGGGARR
jgi:predicted MFS family arabinose efflux permease